jgi:hypothetical protein
MEMNDPMEMLDPELREVVREMTPEEMLLLADELDRRAKVMRWFSICADGDFYSQAYALGHLRRSLFLAGESDPEAN